VDEEGEKASVDDTAKAAMVAAIVENFMVLIM